MSATCIEPDPADLLTICRRLAAVFAQRFDEGDELSGIDDSLACADTVSSHAILRPLRGSNPK